MNDQRYVFDKRLLDRIEELERRCHDLETVYLGDHTPLVIDSPEARTEARIRVMSESKRLGEAYKEALIRLWNRWGR